VAVGAEVQQPGIGLEERGEVRGQHAAALSP
jgi:hypothetical protein